MFSKVCCLPSWRLWRQSLEAFWAKRFFLTLTKCRFIVNLVFLKVIKAISNKDAPHNNYFFYNPLESCGVVETIGY